VGLGILKGCYVERRNLVDKVGVVVDGALVARSTAERFASERGRGDGNDQHRCPGDDQQPENQRSHAVPECHAVSEAYGQMDARYDKEDASGDSRDDGHHQGGHHQAFVPASCSSNGQTSGDEEEDRGPDSSGNGQVVNNQVCDLDTEGNQAKDDVDDAKHCCRLDVVRIFDVHLLLGSLDDVDHLVGRAWIIWLLHCDFPCFQFSSTS